MNMISCESVVRSISSTMYKLKGESVWKKKKYELNYNIVILSLVEKYIPFTVDGGIENRKSKPTAAVLFHWSDTCRTFPPLFPVSIILVSGSNNLQIWTSTFVLNWCCHMMRLNDSAICLNAMVIESQILIAEAIFYMHCSNIRKFYNHLSNEIWFIFH